jgi:hypothetical protein
MLECYRICIPPLHFAIRVIWSGRFYVAGLDFGCGFDENPELILYFLIRHHVDFLSVDQVRLPVQRAVEPHVDNFDFGEYLVN